MPVPEATPADRNRPKEGRYVSVGRSALNHLWIVVLVTILGVALGAAGGLARSPVWKAQSRLIVGKTVSADNLAATAGLADAEISIAANYTKLVGTPAVTKAVVKQLGHEIDGSLSASAVPDSSVILVDSSGTSSAAAVKLADAGSKALVSAVETLNQQTTATNQDLLTRFNTASAQKATDSEQLALLQSEANGLQTQISEALLTTATPAQKIAAGTAQQLLTPIIAQISQATAKVAADTLQTTILETQYQNNYNPNQAEEQIVSSLGTAASLGSNRTSNLEIGLILGAVGGLIVGIGLASSLDILGRTRRSRREH
jgi:hypothetical protein